MSKLDFYKNETKQKTEKIYMEVAEELGLTYPKVVAIVRDGLFKYIKEMIFKKYSNIQIRGFGTFYISKRKLSNLNESKKEDYEEQRKVTGYTKEI